MTLIIQKFGGTSVATIDNLKNAARRVAFERKKGHQVVVVVSAMAGMTNQLIGYVRALDPIALSDEYDVVVSSGEQITSGLLALALQELGIAACSLQGWQLPLKTDDCHGKARIQDIPPETLRALLEQDRVPIVAGFQGLSPSGRITTFGRGGSDITAVALAVALHANRCDLYKDVAGIYTADPRIVAQARKLDQVSYEEMLELASLGSKVLQPRAVELALAHRIPLRIFSSFEQSQGTEIIHEDDMIEKVLIHGIACTHQEIKITLNTLTSHQDMAAHVFRLLAAAHISVDMILQQQLTATDVSPLTFTVAQGDAAQAMALLNTHLTSLNENLRMVDETVAKISVVGVGLRSHPALTATLFQALAQRGIPTLGIATSEIKISVLVPQDFAELAVRTLHTAYQLDEEMPALNGSSLQQNIV